MQILSCAFNYVKLKDSFDSVCMCLPFLHTDQVEKSGIGKGKESKSGDWATGPKRAGG